MNLKQYQEVAVDKLLSITEKLLAKENTRICVLKAPTGAGKTIVLAEWLRELSAQNLTHQYSFIWISGNKLHVQSKKKLESYLKDSRYSFSLIEDIQGSEFNENEIVFINWHSLTKQDKKTGEYTNVFMRDNEQNRNLRTFVENTKEEGREIILIVDESHYHYWSTKSQELVQNIIAPKLILEVSATPAITPTPEELENNDAGFVSVKFEDVVNEGMIKKEVIINSEIGNYVNFLSEHDETILKASVEKLKELQDLYIANNLPVNPLLLIQLPSEGEKTSQLDETKIEQVIRILRDSFGITIENGKLGIWLSNDKENIDNIENNDSPVEVLIFKQAIALGWDCPRAQILVMFREIKSIVFEIQTVGRILRTPEAKHYENLELDRAYVFTNLERIAIKEDKDSQSLFQVFVSHRKSEYSLLNLPSIYLKRVDYGDLTLKFRTLFFEEANKYFQINGTDLPFEAKEKASVKIELEPAKLTKPIIVDAIFTNIDEQSKHEITGKSVNFNYSEDEIKFMYEAFAKLASLPFAPSRSHNKIQMSLYDWFDAFLGYKQNSRIDIQKVIVCSEHNQKVFKEIIDRAKERFNEERKKEINTTDRLKHLFWNIPTVEYFNESYEQELSDNYIMDKCYLRKDRSKPEKEFESILKGSKKVAWWFKNGTEKETDFALEYIDSRTEVLRAFYPDYIVLFIDGSLGIFDTKSGETAQSVETKDKSNALQRYIKSQQKDKKIHGGIVQLTHSGFYIFEQENYQFENLDNGWDRLSF